MSDRCAVGFTCEQCRYMTCTPPHSETAAPSPLCRRYKRAIWKDGHGMYLRSSICIRQNGGVAKDANTDA